jgi:hypothetical protein
MGPLDRDVAITSPSPGRWPDAARPAASQASMVCEMNIHIVKSEPTAQHGYRYEIQP